MVPAKAVHREASARSAEFVVAILRSDIGQTSAADLVPVERGIRSPELAASHFEAEERKIENIKHL